MPTQRKHLKIEIRARVRNNAVRAVNHIAVNRIVAEPTLSGVATDEIT
jgi:hypothetical protein